MTLGVFISNSSLPQEDKDLWFSILGKIDDFQTKVFEDFIGVKEENLKLLTDNIKAKESAFRNSDEKALEKILKEETASI